MSAITQKEVAAITDIALTMPERAAVALGTTATEINLRELVKSSADIVAVIDAPGREQAHRIGMNLKGARVAIEKVGKTAREDATAFSKAIIAEEKRLIAISEPEESRILILRDGFDQAEQARKDAAIAAERARTDAIADAIESIRERETDLIRMTKTAEEAQAQIDSLAALEIREVVYQERLHEARMLKASVLDAMCMVRGTRFEAEAAALAAEQARIAEAARIAAEVAQLAADRAELAEQQRVAKVEADWIAAAQAVEAKRLQELAWEAAASLQAERDAIAEQVQAIKAKSEAEQVERDRVAAEAQRKMDAQQAAIAAEREALAREQLEAIARQEAAFKLRADHADALDDNAIIDDALMTAHMAALEMNADCPVCGPHGICGSCDKWADAHARDLARHTANAAALLADARNTQSRQVYPLSILGLMAEPEMTDDDIIEWGKEWEMDTPALVARLEEFCVRARDVMGVAM